MVSPRLIIMGVCVLGLASVAASGYAYETLIRTPGFGVYLGVAILCVILLLCAAALHIYRVNSKLQNMLRLMRSVDVQQRNQNVVLSQIVADDPLSETLTSLLQGVEHSKPYLKCSILLVDYEHNRFEVIAAPNVPEFYNNAVDGLPLDATMGAFGEAAATGERVITPDIQNHAHWSGLKDVAAQAGLVSCWAEPIINRNNHIVGVFAIYTDRIYQPGSDDIQLIEESAHLAEIAIERKLSLEALRKSEELHRIMAQYDSLTGLPNRALFADRLQQALSYCKRHQRVLAVMLLDLDKFKPVNDDYGHATGDELLTQISQRLLTCVRASDTVARIGGDEFVILLHQIDDHSQACVVSDKIHQALTQEFFINGQRILIGCSIGAAFYPQDATEAHELTQIADQRMYQQKRLDQDATR